MHWSRLKLIGYQYINRAPQPEMEPGAQAEVTFPQDFTILLPKASIKGLKF